MEENKTNLIQLGRNSLERAKNSLTITQKLLLEKSTGDRVSAEYYFKIAQNKPAQDLTRIEDYTKAIEYDFNYDLAYKSRGIAKAELLKDYHGAIADFSKTLDINPDNWEAYFARGLAKQNIKDLEQAIADFTKTLEIKPNYWKAYRFRANIKVRLKDYQSAILDYFQALVLLNHGTEHLSDYMEIIKNATVAIEINPNGLYAYNERGLAKANLKNYEGAIEDYKEAIRINPMYAIAHYNSGVANEKMMGHSKEAILDYTAAITADPNFSNAYANRGYVMANERNDFIMAIDDCNKAIEIDPKNSRAYIKRSAVRIIIDDYVGAKADLKKAIELDPNNNSDEISNLWSSFPTKIEDQYSPPTDEEREEQEKFLDSFIDDLNNSENAD